jgi:tetrathionate reductase subunit B
MLAMPLSSFAGGEVMANPLERKVVRYGRRSFIKKLAMTLTSLMIPGFLYASEKSRKIKKWVLSNGYSPNDHYWGMGIDINKCIGCGRCVQACKTENNVPLEPFFFRTWVERYRISEEGNAIVDSPDGAINSFQNESLEQVTIRSFFVPKLCNHCDNPPCVQVCPVGATFISPDGVVLVDSDYCIGCRYCIQACPYGARFLHPETRTAEKCTFCYHRIVKGLLPACVEACPTQARIFGEVKKKASPLTRFRRMNNIGVLKPSLNTEPKVLYANLDMEVD